MAKEEKKKQRNHLWSIMRTLTPFFANALHAMTPAGPAPMMSTSTWLSDIDGVGDDILWISPKHKRWEGYSDLG